MDGHEIHGSPTRKHSTPGSPAPAPKTPTITDPKVLYQKGFISQAQMTAAITKSEKACREAFNDVCLAFNFESLMEGTTQRPATSPDNMEKLLKSTQAKDWKFTACREGNDQKSTVDNSLITALLKLSPSDLGRSQKDEFYKTKIKQYRIEIAGLLMEHKAKQEAETDKNKREKTPVLRKNDSIDLEHLPFLIKAMQKDKSLTNTDFKIELWRASNTGQPVKLSLLDGTNPVVLFKGTDGFMVVTSKKNNSADDGPIIEEISDDNDNDNDNDNV